MKIELIVKEASTAEIQAILAIVSDGRAVARPAPPLATATPVAAAPLPPPMQAPAAAPAMPPPTVAAPVQVAPAQTVAPPMAQPPPGPGAVTHTMVLTAMQSYARVYKSAGVKAVLQQINATKVQDVTDQAQLKWLFDTFTAGLTK